MSIERKKIEAELAAVTAARLQQEYQIMQREEEIERLKKHVDIQLQKEKELNDQLKGK